MRGDALRPHVLSPEALATALAAASAGCLVGVPREATQRLADLPTGASTAARRVPSLTSRVWQPAAAALLAGVLLLKLGPVVVVLSLLVAAVARRALLARRGEQDRARERRHAVEACAGLAGELRAGRSPAAALAVAADLACGPSAVLMRAAASAAQLGGDVPAALTPATSSPARRRGGVPSVGAGALPRADLHGWSAAALGAGSRRPRRSAGPSTPRAPAVSASASGPTAVPEVLRALAACWSVCSSTGSGLASAVDRLEEALRADEDRRRAVDAELAGPRATAGMLAVLPVAGILLAAGLGADPVHLLLHTAFGLGCLSAGVALDGLGLLWTARLVARAGGTR